MIAEDATRNFGAKPGYALHDSIDLDGWDERSVSGYDDGVGSFYAQLWRNPGDREAPDVWLSGAAPRYPWPGSLALAVVEATRRDPVRASSAPSDSPTRTLLSARPASSRAPSIAYPIRVATPTRRANSPSTNGRSPAPDQRTARGCRGTASSPPRSTRQPSST